MTERKLLRLALLGAGAFLLLGHSPYRQWYAYRAKHLVVVSAESRPGASELGAAVAEAIAAGVPRSKAVAALVQTTADVVKLLRSEQLQVGLLPSAVARAAVDGTGAFVGEGPLPLRALAVFGDDVLVTLDTFPAAKARQISSAVASRPREWPGMVPATSPGAPPIPFHDAVVASN